MNRLEKMELHLKNHPNDYQTAIAFLKYRSKEFDKERKHKQDQMRKDIAMYKKQIKEDDEIAKELQNGN